MTPSIQEVKRRFGIIGRSPLLDHALETAIRVADSDLTVLIKGESGVGKEVFSRVIHQLSPRKHHPFIAVNCGAIPVGTINSELFGHEKGAFTGATAERKGYFETVDGGTIFLDEISEMPLDTQAFLLRVLENGEFIRVGSSVVRKTNVRVIAAANVDLLERVRQGKFRRDLYYRISIVPIHIPALKERREDILLLFRKFAADFAERYRMTPVQLDEEAQNLLVNYSWPGNIRELKNFAEQLSVLSEKRLLGREDLIKVKPEIVRTNMPVPVFENGSPENEMLYKILLELQKDVNQLKRLVVELVKSNNLRMPDADLLHTEDVAPNISLPGAPHIEVLPSSAATSEPVVAKVVTPDMRAEYQKAEIVEESLSLEDMERELIAKALEKHRGRRRDAARDLGISERTLYRKIKQYGLD